MAIGEGLGSTNQASHRYLAEGITAGFFTDPTVCIGCKACEVACKEWNQVPAEPAEWTGTSYDHTGSLGASTWRHVKFLEQEEPFRWLFLSDVCKHCEHAGCLEACPTGSIVRTPVGSVYVQDDVCNGCGYCVVACPFGVIDRRLEPLPGAGGAFKCTFCYDRQADGLVPACAKACPTESIRFGPLAELREEAQRRVETLKGRGVEDATVYDPRDTSVGGTHAISLLIGGPEPWGLPPAPEVPTIHLRAAWTAAALTGIGAIAAAILAFALLPS